MERRRLAEKSNEQLNGTDGVAIPSMRRD